MAASSASGEISEETTVDGVVETTDGNAVDQVRLTRLL
jgi:hypothetical protein